MCERSDIDGVVDMADPFSIVQHKATSFFDTLQNVA